MEIYPSGNLQILVQGFLIETGLLMLRKVLIFSLVWILALFPVYASSVLPLYLDQIVAGAHVAFQGICTGNRSEREAETGLIVTYSSFDVTDVLKGKAGATYTIKQLGGQIETGGYSVHGIPSTSPQEI